MNGADSQRSGDYHPDTTSYDYDAPLNEGGDPTYKFDLFRKAIEVAKVQPTPIPAAAARGTFTIATLTLSASLWRNQPTPTKSKNAADL